MSASAEVVGCRHRVKLHMSCHANRSLGGVDVMVRRLCSAWFSAPDEYPAHVLQGMITGAQGLGEDSDVTEVLESLDAHTAVVRCDPGTLHPNTLQLCRSKQTGVRAHAHPTRGQRPAHCIAAGRSKQSSCASDAELLVYRHCYMLSAWPDCNIQTRQASRRADMQESVHHGQVRESWPPPRLLRPFIATRELVLRRSWRREVRTSYSAASSHAAATSIAHLPSCRPREEGHTYQDHHSTSTDGVPTSAYTA